MYKYLLLFLSFSTGICNAQSNKYTKSETDGGMVIYKQKITLRVPVYTLDTLRFNRNKSIFHWRLYNSHVQYSAKIKRKYPNIKKTEGATISGQINLVDIKKDSLYSRMTLRHLNDIYYLKEKIPTINWKIADSTKKVGNYKVKKAKTHFRGRNYTAWFAPEIPVAFGPWKLHGLPGLILQAYDQSSNIYFSATHINFTHGENIDPIFLNGKEQLLTLEQYKELMNQFTKVEKKKLLKTARKYMSKEDFSRVEVNLPDIQLIEMFEDEPISN